jgi:hypothetical protein
MADRESPSDLIVEARKRWVRAMEAEEQQRKRIVLAKKFRIGDQWPDAIKLARQGGNAIQGQAPQPPRPCLVVDRLSQPVRQVSNTIKNAAFGFDVLPAGGGSDSDTADIFKGYLRWMQNNSRGESPIEWAADGAIESGIGWFRLRTDYVNETWDGALTDEVMWQALFLERITNSLTVYCDPAAVKPTRSDAQFMFITEDISKDEFKRLFPKADVRGLENFIATGDRGKMGTWATEDMVRIAEYWRIVYQNRTLSLMPDGSVVEGKQKGAEQTRVMRVPTVKCDKINAIQSLEQYEWVGSRIPIIPILGEELNIDGKVWLRGIIEEGMDAQRMVNYTYSGAVEIFALAPKNAPMVAAQSVANYKSTWQTRNTVNHAYLPYDPFGPDGQQYPPPVLDTTEPPIQAAVELMRVSEDAIKATTSTGDASLGNTNPNERSGRALQALQSQSDLANSNYPDNVRRALIYAAELALEVIPKITKPGQVIHILGMDDEPQQVIVGQPFMPGEKGQPPTPRPDIDPEIAKLKDTLPKFYDLNNGKYAVTVSVGKATATKREEGAAALGELIPHLPPPMAAVLTPEYIEQLSMPNAHKMAEIARNALPPELRAATDQNGQQGQIPPQVMAQVQQMQQQLQQAQQIIQTKQVEQQGSLEETKIKAQSDQAIAAHKASSDADLQMALQVMKDATTISVAHINARTKGVDMAAHAQEEAQALGHEQTQNAFDRQHDVNMAQLGHQQAMQQGDQGHQQALEQGDQSAQNAQEQQQSDQQHQAEMAQQAQEAAAQQPEASA